jgi:FixJ family two-component response regulator
MSGALVVQVEQTTLCVAVVEDDRQTRLSLDVTLRRAGYRTFLYESADACLATLEEDPSSRALADVLVTDLQMRGTKGGELIRRLDAQALFLPVVVITAHDTSELASQFAQRFALCFLRKPFHPQELVDAVARVYATYLTMVNGTKTKTGKGGVCP